MLPLSHDPLGGPFFDDTVELGVVAGEPLTRMVPTLSLHLLPVNPLCEGSPARLVASLPPAPFSPVSNTVHLTFLSRSPWAQHRPDIPPPMMATLALPSASDPEYSHVFSHFEEEDELRFFLDDDDDCCRRLDTLLDMPFAFCFGRAGPCNPPSGPPGPPGAMSVLYLSLQNNRTERSLHSNETHTTNVKARGATGRGSGPVVRFRSPLTPLPPAGVPMCQRTGATSYLWI